MDGFREDYGFANWVTYDKGSYVGLEIRYNFGFVNVVRHYSRPAAILPRWWIAATC